MALISKKKISYKISPPLRDYLINHDRAKPIPLSYHDLARYNNHIPLFDRYGKDTLWETVLYPQFEMQTIYPSLKKIYSLLKADGDVSVIDHLYIDRIDVCPFGNTKPFRVRIANKINDNFDYFYVKIADASRVYGLELEHLVSPNRINFIVDGDTLIEEHIAGIPGDKFIKYHLSDKSLNPIRIAKEFVKFNERCFVRLLGDMHSSNFVIDVTPDFEENHYRIRAIDFDQQSYEGRKAVYMPKYFKQNNPLIALGLKLMTPESVTQYQKEERSLITARLKRARNTITDLLKAMTQDTVSTPEHIANLRIELAQHYQNDTFLTCQNMGQIVQQSLRMLVKNL
jgi:hypothetical protein